MILAKKSEQGSDADALDNNPAKTVSHEDDRPHCRLPKLTSTIHVSLVLQILHL